MTATSQISRGGLWIAELALGLAAIVAGAAGTAEDAAEPNPRLTLSVEGGRLGLDAREVPLETVLHAVGREGGFALVVRGELRDMVSTSFKDMPLDRAIEKLVGENSFVIEWEPKTAMGVLEFRRLIVISGGASGDRQPPAVSVAPAEGLEEGMRARMREVRVLGRDRSPEALAKLSDFLLNDQEPLVRLAAAKNLARVHSELGVDALVSALDDMAAAVRRRAIISLGKVGGELAVERLIDVLRWGPDWQDQVLAARALSRYRSQEARRALLDAARDRNAHVRKAAKASLL